MNGQRGITLIHNNTKYYWWQRRIFLVRFTGALCAPLALLDIKRAVLMVAEVPGLVLGVLGGRTGQGGGCLQRRRQLYILILNEIIN